MKKIYIVLLYSLIPFLSAAQVKLDSGLIAYYPFNGNANDSSGNGNNGTVYGATLTSDRNGNPNSAYYFNGTSDYISVPNSASLTPTGAFTLTAIVKPEGFYSGTCQGNVILWKGNSYVAGHYGLTFSATPYGIGCNGFDPLHETFYGEMGSNPETPISQLYTPYITPNTYYCVIYTWDGDSMKLYVNGTLEYSVSAPNPLGTNSYGLSIGSNQFNLAYPYWFNGVMDEIRIYNRLLNSDEISAYCSAGVVLPVCNFQSSDTVLCANDCVNYTDLSTNATTWQWSFPGATPSSSTVQNPFVCYLTAGHYDATLIASNGGGSDTLKLSNYITVHPAPPTPLITQSSDSLFCSFDSSYASYQWYIDTTLIVGATNPFYIGPCGDYNVSVTDTNGCMIAVGINAECLGVRNLFDEKNTIISPNPATNQLTIHTSSFHNEAVTVSIMNVLGQIMQEEKLKWSNDASMDIKSLSFGIYFLQMKSETGSVVRRFIKE